MDWAQDRQVKEDQFNTFYHIAPHIVSKSLPDIEWYLASTPTQNPPSKMKVSQKKKNDERKSFLIQNPPPTNSTP